MMRDRHELNAELLRALEQWPRSTVIIKLFSTGRSNVRDDANTLRMLINEQVQDTCRGCGEDEALVLMDRVVQRTPRRMVSMAYTVTAAEQRRHDMMVHDMRSTAQEADQHSNPYGIGSRVTVEVIGR